MLRKILIVGMLAGMFASVGDAQDVKQIIGTSTAYTYGFGEDNDYPYSPYYWSGDDTDIATTSAKSTVNMLHGSGLKFETATKSSGTSTWTSDAEMWVNTEDDNTGSGYSHQNCYGTCTKFDTFRNTATTSKTVTGTLSVYIQFNNNVLLFPHQHEADGASYGSLVYGDYTLSWDVGMAGETTYTLTKAGVVKSSGTKWPSATGGNYSLMIGPFTGKTITLAPNAQFNTSISAYSDTKNTNPGGSPLYVGRDVKVDAGITFHE